MAKHTKSIMFGCLFLLLVGIPSLHAYWQEGGVPISTATGDQDIPTIISDGAGGAIMTWYDNRSGNDDIYAQKIDAYGTVQWTADGVAICTATNNQAYPQIVSDGAGGAIITWDDNRSGDYNIYAQRIDAAGTVQWTTDGVAICAATGSQNWPQPTSDGAGGAIITWHDNRSADYDIYAQRINAGGTVQWTANGVAICAATSSQYRPQITTDGAGGAIITWYDFRGGEPDIYAQRIIASGTVWWLADGRPICTATSFQEYPRIISDGGSGAIITWTDTRNGNYDIYAQRVNSSGSAVWTANGEAICAATGFQGEPQLCSDNAGGAIITWYDYRSSSDNDVYAQRIRTNGATDWTVDGIGIIVWDKDQWYPQIIPDGLGGAIITWFDYRSENDYDVYAQRVDEDGSLLWLSSGVAISTETGNQRDPKIASDGEGGAIVTWVDERTGIKDVYAQRVERNGYWGYPSPYIHAVRDVPGDQGGYVNLSWDASHLDPWPNMQITNYTVWRAINPTSAMIMAGEGAPLLHSAMEFPVVLEEISIDHKEPVILRQALGAQIYYWYLIDTIDAYYLPSYSAPEPTMFDSTATSDEYHYFQVISHTSNPQVFWISPPDSGYSVDNLAPGVPMALAGEQSYVPEGLVLTWDPNTESDLSNYTVYRGISEGFVPGPGNLVASHFDTTTFDGGWTWDGGFYYKVAAVDVHGNESGYALLRPSDITGDEPVTPPVADFLDQNFPNPFNPNTTIKLGLKERSPVSLKIYNASGRLVRILVEEVRDAARYEEVWDGRDNTGRTVASGIYFYRLVAGDFVQARKMVLLR